MSDLLAAVKAKIAHEAQPFSEFWEVKPEEIADESAQAVIALVQDAARARLVDHALLAVTPQGQQYQPSPLWRVHCICGYRGAARHIERHDAYREWAEHAIPAVQNA